MVEGLTSSATDQGSVAGNQDRILTDSRDRRSTSAPRRSIGPRDGPLPNNIQTQRNPGDSSGEAIPVPIPNTEVKLSSAEDTERAAFRENRSSPGFLRFRGVARGAGRRERSRPLVRASGILCRDDRPRRRAAGAPRAPPEPADDPAEPRDGRRAHRPDDRRDLSVPARGRRRLAERVAAPRASLRAPSSRRRRCRTDKQRRLCLVRRARRLPDVPGRARAPRARCSRRASIPRSSRPPMPPAGPIARGPRRHPRAARGSRSDGALGRSTGRCRPGRPRRADGRRVRRRR